MYTLVLFDFLLYLLKMLITVHLKPWTFFEKICIFLILSINFLSLRKMHILSQHFAMIFPSVIDLICDILNGLCPVCVF